MTLGDDWRYCPECAEPLIHQRRGDLPRPACPRCGFLFFASMGVGVAAVIQDAAGRVILVQRAEGQFGAGHMLPYEQPDLFVQALHKFLG